MIIFRTTFILSLFSSLAFAGNVNMRGSGEDCSDRRSPFSDIQSYVTNVSMVGEENGRVISNDPTTAEAQLGEASGHSLACGKFSAQLSLIEHKGKKYLLGAAHSFYENGALKCDEGFGSFYPDHHYKDANNPNIDPEKSYRFKLPPLNDASALKKDFNKLSLESINDFVILEIEDTSLLQNQLGQERTSLRLANLSTADLPSYSQDNNVQISGVRDNFQNYQSTAINDNCSIRSFIGPASAIGALKHSCDTGNGSSGASLITLRNNQAYSLGVHFHSTSTPTSDQDFIDSDRGNYLIPSEKIIQSIENLQVEDTPPSVEA